MHPPGAIVCQIDIEGAYPNEILTADEATPPGLSIPNPFGKILAGGLHETFYGLKQPEGWWYQWSVGSYDGGYQISKGRRGPFEGREMGDM